MKISLRYVVLFLLSWQFKQVAKCQHFDYDIKEKKEFVVELSSNPSTGYQWYWANHGEVKIIDSVARKFVASKPVRVGSGGKLFWTFKALHSGTAEIILHHKRPGQPLSSPDHVKIISVRVRE